MSWGSVWGFHTSPLLGDFLITEKLLNHNFSKWMMKKFPGLQKNRRQKVIFIHLTLDLALPMDDALSAGVTGVGLAIPTGSLWLTATSLIPNVASLTWTTPERALMTHREKRAIIRVILDYSKTNWSVLKSFLWTIGHYFSSRQYFFLNSVYTHKGVHADRVLHTASITGATFIDIFADLDGKKKQKENPQT